MSWRSADGDNHKTSVTLSRPRALAVAASPASLASPQPPFLPFKSVTSSVVTTSFKKLRLDAHDGAADIAGNEGGLVLGSAKRGRSASETSQEFDDFYKAYFTDYELFDSSGPGQRNRAVQHAVELSNEYQRLGVVVDNELTTEQAKKLLEAIYATGMKALVKWAHAETRTPLPPRRRSLFGSFGLREGSDPSLRKFPECSSVSVKTLQDVSEKTLRSGNPKLFFRHTRPRPNRPTVTTGRRTHTPNRPTHPTVPRAPHAMAARSISALRCAFSSSVPTMHAHVRL